MARCSADIRWPPESFDDVTLRHPTISPAALERWQDAIDVSPPKGSTIRKVRFPQDWSRLDHGSQESETTTWGRMDHGHSAGFAASRLLFVAICPVGSGRFRGIPISTFYGHHRGLDFRAFQPCRGTRD